MHVLAFAFKRAHYVSLKLARPYAHAAGLTPARVDLLYSIKPGSGYFWQASLARKLGVSAVTISRMLRALEKLGLIARERHRFVDGRKLYLRLTRRGRKRLYGALLGIGKTRMQHAYERAMSGVPSWKAFLKVDDTFWRLWNMKRALGDRAGFLYPDWHPDN